MKIDLRSILHGERKFQFQVGPQWWEEHCRDNAALDLDGALAVTILVSRADSKYILDGELKGSVILQCDRCLESYRRKLEREFRIVLVARTDEDGQTEVELFREDLEEGFISDFVLDLADITREEVFLALPMKNLCRKGCAGLCPLCGANLNGKGCGCKIVGGRPEFSRLKELGPLPDKDSNVQKGGMDRGRTDENNEPLSPHDRS